MTQTSENGIVRLLVFQSPVATGGKNWQPNQTATDLDQTVVAGSRGRMIRSVAVAVARTNLKNRLQPVYFTTGPHKKHKYIELCTIHTIILNYTNRYGWGWPCVCMHEGLHARRCVGGTVCR